MQDAVHAFQQQLHALNALDWVLAVSLFVSTCSAFFKGFIASAVALVGACAAIAAALVYGPRFAPILLGWVGSPLIATVAAFTLILVAVYLCITLVGQLLRGAFRAVGLGFVDRVAGAAFGLARGLLLLAGLALPTGRYLQDSAEGQASILLPYLLRVSHGVSSVIPHDAGRQWSLERWTGWPRSPVAPAP